MGKLERCPFCGSNKLKVDSKKINRPRYLETGKWEDGHTGSMRCKCCHARGPTVTVWVPRHIRVSGGGATVYGWVDENTFTKA